MKVKHEDRFSDMELFAMFNIAVPCQDKKGREFVAPLWKVKQRKLKRGEQNALQSEDLIKEGVSQHPPGSAGRIADLTTHYEGWEKEGHKSAFYSC